MATAGEGTGKWEARGSEGVGSSANRALKQKLRYVAVHSLIATEQAEGGAVCLTHIPILILHATYTTVYSSAQNPIHKATLHAA